MGDTFPPPRPTHTMAEVRKHIEELKVHMKAIEEGLTANYARAGAVGGLPNNEEGCTPDHIAVDNAVAAMRNSLKRTVPLAKPRKRT